MLFVHFMLSASPKFPGEAGYTGHGNLNLRTSSRLQMLWGLVNECGRKEEKRKAGDLNILYLAGRGDI